MVNETTLGILEYDRLLALISGFSHSEASHRDILNLRPLATREEIKERLALISEIRTGTEDGKPLPISLFSDISPLFIRIRPQEAVLEPQELAAFIPVLSIADDLSRLIGERVDCPRLAALAENLSDHGHVLKLLKRSFDGEGRILDSASPELSDLRGRARRLEGTIKKRLEEIVRDENVSLFLQDSFITQRSGRWVIPVRMDSKGQVPGVVHDISRSGETAFIEPLHILSLSNKFENLLAEVKGEEIRILRTICAVIREVVDEMDKTYRTLVYLDVLNSIAAFSDRQRMQTPRFNDSNSIRLVKARHPLMIASVRQGEGRREIVPLDISLGADEKVMVITGANAGGKTIAIKTVGLLVVMALSGMPVPADSSSSVPLVEDVLVDIGDEQSIENSLSTFSAHVSNIAGILEKAGPATLVLLDELGTGTDPDEGTALACAVLKELSTRKCLVFATTHLMGIKGFVHISEGMVNAAMEFDPKTMTPLYRLRIGEPGRSHALEIAAQYGLPESIIASAREMLGSLKIEFENLITDLNEKRLEHEEGLRELAEQREAVGEESKLLQQRMAELEAARKEIMGKAYRESAEIVLSIKRELHSLLEEARKRDAAKTREIIKQVESRQDELSRKVMEYETDAGAAPSLSSLREGDAVYVRSLGYDAVVVKVDIRHGRLRVRAGNREIEVPSADVGTKRGITVTVKTESPHRTEPEAETLSRITLIGMRVDEALSLLEPFLNHASLSGLTEVTVIHGYGTGILSRAVREHLTGHPLVKKFRRGDQAEGGNGATVVTLL